MDFLTALNTNKRLVKTGRVVSEVRSHVDRQTHTHARLSNLLPMHRRWTDNTNQYYTQYCTDPRNNCNSKLLPMLVFSAFQCLNACLIWKQNKLHHQFITEEYLSLTVTEPVNNNQTLRTACTKENSFLWTVLTWGPIYKISYNNLTTILR